MSGPNGTLRDPTVINVRGMLVAQIDALMSRYGLSDIEIVFRDGKYFLRVEGRLIEIRFVNGEAIDVAVLDDLQRQLGSLLEQNGFQPTELTNGLNAEQVGNSGQGTAAGLALFTWFSALGYVVTENRRSATNESARTGSRLIDLPEKNNTMSQTTNSDIEFLRISKNALEKFVYISSGLFDPIINLNENGISLYEDTEFEVLSENEISITYFDQQAIVTGPGINIFLQKFLQEATEENYLNMFKVAEGIEFRVGNEILFVSKIIDNFFIIEAGDYEMRFEGDFKGQISDVQFPLPFLPIDVKPFSSSVSVLKDDKVQLSMSFIDDKVMNFITSGANATLRGDWSKLSLEDQLNLVDMLFTLDVNNLGAVREFYSYFNVENIEINEVLSPASASILKASFSFGRYLDGFEDDYNSNEIEIFATNTDQTDYFELTLNSKTYTIEPTSYPAYFYVPLADFKALSEGIVPFDIKLYNSNGAVKAQYNSTFIYDPSEVRFEEIIYASGRSTFNNFTAGIDGSGDDTVELILDVSDASAGDTVELYIDAKMPAIFSQTLTASDVNVGSVSTGWLKFSDAIDQDVLLEIAVKRSDGVYIQHDGYGIWEYQW